MKKKSEYVGEGGPTGGHGPRDSGQGQQVADHATDGEDDGGGDQKSEADHRLAPVAARIPKDALRGRSGTA